jgi:DNA polymerase-3 subunit delta'
MSIYPWQTGAWQQLISARQDLPHALLLQGKKGIGKTDLARELAQALLCESPSSSGNACRQCAACGWFAAGNHPDFRLVEPEGAGAPAAEAAEGERPAEKKTGLIAVSQVRELTDFVNLTTHRNGMRVILIHPAEAMNVHAANALLKTLEEPPPRTVFLLVSHQPQRLLPTVRSRCRKVDLPAPSPSQSIQWLQEQGVADAPLCLAQSGNAPLEAQLLSSPEYQEQRGRFLTWLSEPGRLDPLAVAEQAEKFDLGSVVNWLQKWVYDLVGSRLTGQVRYQTDFSDKISSLSGKVNLLSLLAYQRDLLSVYRTVHHPLNHRLVLEQMLVGYWKIIAHQEHAHA